MSSKSHQDYIKAVEEIYQNKNGKPEFLVEKEKERQDDINRGITESIIQDEKEQKKRYEEEKKREKEQEQQKKKKNI